VFALTSFPFEVGGGLLGSAVALTDAGAPGHQPAGTSHSPILNVSGDALQAGTLHNSGTVQLGGGAPRITTTQLTNTGRVLVSGASGSGQQRRRADPRDWPGAARRRGLSNSTARWGKFPAQVGGTLENARRLRWDAACSRPVP
jgi:hypothetical protein